MRRLLQLSILGLCFCPLLLHAQTFFIVDNIRYMIEDDHAVIARQNQELSGNVIIPATVTYEGNDYNVTRLMSPDEIESSGAGAFQECEITGFSLPACISEIPAFSFYRCNSLSSVTISKNVTTIGYLAFAECSSLSSFNVAEGNSYYSSENGVLFNKNKTILLQYPQGKSETSYNIPNSVTSIPYMAFSGCSSLTSVTIPNSMKIIGEYAFYHCSGLTSITIPKSVTSLGFSAFEGCSRLVEVSIGSNVQSFNSSVFKGCQNLSEVWCYATVVPTVESDAFAESNYKNATLYVRNTLLNEYKTTEIWKSFKEIKNISSLQNYAPYHTIFVADGIRYMTEDDEAVIARQDRELTGDFVIPSKVTYEGIEYNVTRLLSPDDSESGGGGAFQECEITSISLPASITDIPDFTFAKCKQLSGVTLQGPVTHIGESSFSHCEVLSTIDLPDAVTEIERFAFQGSGLTKFKVPAGVTVLEEIVCADTKITNIEIPATVIQLKSSCFGNWETESKPVEKTIKMFQRDCREIETHVSAFGNMYEIDLQVPAGGKVVYQEYYPWSNMRSITEYGDDTGETLVPDQRHVTIDGIRYVLKDGEASVDIQPATLSGEVAIPEAVTYESVDYPVTTIMGPYIGTPGWSAYKPDDLFGGAFSKTQVTKVTLPASIKTIGYCAFIQAQKLQEVVLNEGITEIVEGAFMECPELTTINIPTTVTVLPKYIFKDSPKLKNLTLHEGLTEIREEALYNTGIETLTIPSTCTLFNACALYLPNLKTLYMNIKEPTDIQAVSYYGDARVMNSSVFSDYNGLFDDQSATRERLSQTDLIVPLGCAESYKAQAPWSSFRSVTDAGSPFLKLNGSVFTAPEGSFTVEDESLVYEDHSSWYIEDYTKGLAIDKDTKIKFTTTASKSWVYIYLFSSNTSKVKIDGTIVANVGEDQSTSSYTFYRYDVLVDAGEHVITCDDYTGNQVPCMFLLRVQDASGAYYQPGKMGVNIDGINYVLEEKTIEGQTVRTATISRQETSLSGDITIPAKVSYAKTVLQDSEWVTLEAHDYNVTEMVAAGYESRQSPGIFHTIDGAFQECGITSISLPATLATIPAGAFNGCQQLKSVTLAEGITTIGGGAFANCTSLEDIYLPETITDMSDYYVFGNCRSLKKVNIPKLVTALGNGCFMRSGIETFLIPKNVKSIGEACFAAEGEETSVKSIKICHDSYSDGSISFPENAFNEVSGITLIVPEGTKASLYSQVYPWKDFGTIIEYTDQNDEHQYNAYRIKLEEESDENPATARRRTSEITATETTIGFTPSGVLLELPAEVEKDGILYTVQYKNAPTTMPAEDVVVKASLTPAELVSVTISSIGKLAYSSDKALDFSNVAGLKAYTVTGYDNDSKTIWMTRVNEVPAGTGIMLKGEAGTYQIPVKTTSKSSYKNYMKAIAEGGTVYQTEGDLTNYYLAADGDNGPGLYQVGGSGVTLGANRSYLQLPTTLSSTGSDGTEIITISSIGKLVYSSSNSLDFTNVAGLKAYTVTGYNKATGTIWLSRVNKVPAETGIYLKGDPGDYTVPTLSMSGCYSNMLKSCVVSSVISDTEGDLINYYLAADGTNGPGFYPVEGSVTLGNNRSYLQIPTTVGTSSRAAAVHRPSVDYGNIESQVESMPLFGVNHSDATAIESIKNDSTSEDVLYNINGQRTTSPSKGVYIKNGKKIIVL